MIFRKHWYLFVFYDQSEGKRSIAQTITGYRTRGINLARIQENKRHADVGEKSMLINSVHLGCMTRKSFLKGHKLINKAQRDEVCSKYN